MKIQQANMGIYTTSPLNKFVTMPGLVAPPQSSTSIPISIPIPYTGQALTLNYYIDLVTHNLEPAGGPYRNVTVSQYRAAGLDANVDFATTNPSTAGTKGVAAYAWFKHDGDVTSDTVVNITGQTSLQYEYRETFMGNTYVTRYTTATATVYSSMTIVNRFQ